MYSHHNFKYRILEYAHLQIKWIYFQMKLILNPFIGHQATRYM